MSNRTFVFDPCKYAFSPFVGPIRECEIWYSQEYPKFSPLPPCINKNELFIQFDMPLLSSPLLSSLGTFASHQYYYQYFIS